MAAERAAAERAVVAAEMAMQRAAVAAERAAAERAAAGMQRAQANAPAKLQVRRLKRRRAEGNAHAMQKLQLATMQNLQVAVQEAQSVWKCRPPPTRAVGSRQMDSFLQMDSPFSHLLLSQQGMTAVLEKWLPLRLEEAQRQLGSTVRRGERAERAGQREGAERAAQRLKRFT
jgi:hypothetical protein